MGQLPTPDRHAGTESRMQQGLSDPDTATFPCCVPGIHDLDQRLALWISQMATAASERNGALGGPFFKAKVARSNRPATRQDLAPRPVIGQAVWQTIREQP